MACLGLKKGHGEKGRNEGYIGCRWERKGVKGEEGDEGKRRRVRMITADTLVRGAVCYSDRLPVHFYRNGSRLITHGEFSVMF